MSGPEFYILEFDYKGLPPELESWATLIPPLDGEDEVMWFFDPEKRPPRTPAIFSSSYTEFDDLDYVMNDCDWPVLSHYALDVLKNLDPEFGVEAFPAIMLNGLYQGEWDERFADRGTAFFIQFSLEFEELRSTHYPVIKVPFLTGKFDWEHSDYERLAPDAGPALVTKYVLKDVEKVPPLFRPVEKPGYLFISGELRAAWKEAGVFGPAYTLPEQTYAPSKTDVDRPRERSSQVVNTGRE